MTNAEIIELLTSLLLSDDSLSEEAMDVIRFYLAAEKDEEAKSEVLQTVLLAALQSSRSSGSLPFSADEESVERGWARLARKLDMNPDIDHYRAILSSRIPSRPSTMRPQHKPVHRSSLGRVALRVAAVLLPVAVVLSGLFAWERSTSGNGAGTDIVATTEAPATFTATQTITTQADDIRHITLVDGTKVTLNSNSTIAYNENREAELSGEAFFKVSKNPGHPFVIYSEGLKVTVLGTEFNFNTRTEEDASKLSLYGGHVMLDHAAGTHRLDAAGREFILDHATGLVQVRDFDMAQRPQWLAAEISSDIMNLGTIFDTIEVIYGVTIANRSAVDTDRRFRFVVDQKIPLDTVMSYLEYLNGEFAYTINGTTVTLTKIQSK